jgi:plasmid rolling circle replication initiator protein Rep
MLAVATEALVRQPTLKFLFLTLTVPNVDLDKLSETLKHITQSWRRLMNRKRVSRVIKGYHRAIEITYNAERQDYHPHMHIILAVNSRYFAEDYINHEDWLKMWQQSTRQPEITQVDIRTIREGGKKFNHRLENAVSEACKYSLKAFNFKRERTGKYKGRIINPVHRKMYKGFMENTIQIDYGFPEHIFIRGTREETAEVVKGLANAIYGKKFTHYGGLFKDIKNDLKLEDGEEIEDLGHKENDANCRCPICDAERRKALFDYVARLHDIPVGEYLRRLKNAKQI